VECYRAKKIPDINKVKSSVSSEKNIFEAKNIKENIDEWTRQAGAKRTSFTTAAFD